MNKELKEQAREEFKGIYPLQQWNENNPDQAIFINPTLQKSHRDICLNFIDALIDKTVQIAEEREKTLKQIHQMQLQAIAIKSVEEFIIWKDSLITNTSDINK